MLKKHIDSQIFAITGRKNGGYDIPLHTRLGTEFLVLLIALMTYLSLLAAAGSIALDHMAGKWVSGLKDTMTIEIPEKQGNMTEARQLLQALQDTKFVKSARILDNNDMADILSPWLGNQTSVLAELPLPVLISVTLKERTPDTTSSIAAMTRRLAPNAIVDAHEEWLNDLLRLTNGLQITAIIIFGLIMFVTALVIAGAVRSRMAIHQRELELLHIMGASDGYISMQFIRYILSQSALGMAYGILGGSVTLLAFALLAHHSPGTIPAINLHGKDWLAFVIVPCLLLAIGTLTARRTVFRVLNEMP